MTIGELSEGLLTVLFESYDILSYITTALAFLFFPTTYWIVESPNYLISLGKYDDAKHMLYKLRSDLPEEKILEEYKCLQEVINVEKSKSSETGWFQILNSRSVRKSLICAVLLNLLVLTHGCTIILLYASIILPSNDYISSSFYPLILSATQLLSSVISTVFIEKYPRRCLFIFGGISIFFVQSFNCVTEYLRFNTSDYQELWKWCFLAGNVIYWVIHNALIVPLNGTIRTEIFPISISGIGSAICLLCQALSTIYCYQLHNVLVFNFGLWATYLSFAFHAIVTVMVVYLLLPEMRGKSLAQMQKEFQISTCEKKVVNNSTCNSKY